MCETNSSSQGKFPMGCSPSQQNHSTHIIKESVTYIFLFAATHYWQQHEPFTYYVFIISDESLQNPT